MNMKVVGIGPGSLEGMTGEARKALEDARLIVGYGLYADLVREYFPDKEYYTTGMRHETERVEYALEKAASGVSTALICSGDAGVYGMASLAFETAERLGLDASEIEIVPGVTAALSCAALLGSPLSCDFAVISLSDLLVPRERIGHRLRCAAESGMPVVIYNPGSKKRKDYLKHACSILLAYRPPETLCGVVRNAGREGQETELMTLGRLSGLEADMLMTVIIGGSETREISGRMVTPRGYASRYGNGRPAAGHELGLESGSGGSTMKQKRNESDSSGTAGSTEERLKSRRILIFGGTSEGRILASCARDAGYETWLSAATDYGRETAEVPGAGCSGVNIISGRMPEEKIEELLLEKKFSCVIDATHPYAVHISKSIEKAAEAADTSLVRVARKTESGPSGEDIMFFDTMDDIVEYLNGCTGKIFFSTGSGAAESYARLDGIAERAAVRILPSADAVGKVKKAGFSSRNIICMQGPFTKEMNRACFRFFGSDYLVTKSSGKAGGFYEKIDAARELGMKILVLAPPPCAEGISMEEAVKMIGEGRFQ
ncbi:MAG: precorrin-3B C(17)-methyltransferase [Anaerovoracaceae bacterium]|jgi:precorrin-3B C17-methyltransferase